VEPILARKVHRSLEPYHGLVYFAPEAVARYAAFGIEGFGGYFPSRAAAMGSVGPEVVVATFLNFRPSLVHDVLPAAWAAAPPSAWLEARLAAVDEALRRTVGHELLRSSDVVRAAEVAGAAAAAAAEHADGRPLALAHAAVARPAEPHLALWHSITVLREHRGDGHVSCLVEAGVDGCGALVLHAATGEVPRAALQGTRGWTDDEWAAAVSRLADRGLVDGDGSFTDAGRSFRDAVEHRTDELAMAPWEAIGEDALGELRGLVRPMSKAIVDSGTFGLGPRR
jgi:hypothetical protein